MCIKSYISLTVKLSFFLLLLSFSTYSQDVYKIRTIAFYNTENLFDTIHQEDKWDEDRTPEGKAHWTSENYHHKIANIASVISRIGIETTKRPPDIIGLCEVENEMVLHDLISHPALMNQQYGVIHFESPDKRGIDVALLFKKDVFIPDSFKAFPLLLKDDEDRRIYTRDQLLVTGRLDGETISFLVNHWPSRRGGEVPSRPARMQAARLTKKIIDSLFRERSESKMVIMGDFNDDPTSMSIKNILKTSDNRQEAKDSLLLYNPMEFMANHGHGSLAHQDQWALFDQLIISSGLLSTPEDSYAFWKAGIYNPPYLITPTGRYKGYPLRSYANGAYTGGYSDHFPVYLYLIKRP